MDLKKEEVALYEQPLLVCTFCKQYYIRISFLLVISPSFVRS